MVNRGGSVKRGNLNKPLPVTIDIIRDLPSLTALIASPALIRVDEPTAVTIMTKITDGRLVASSGLVEEIGATGVVLSVLGELRDDGTNGDLVAGDNIFFAPAHLL